MKYIILCIFFSYHTCHAQINFNANQQVPEYTGGFGYGTNFGYYPFIDEELADLAVGNSEKNIPGAGANTIRPSLPDNFLDYWGYDIRHDAFEHYEAIGLKNIVAFIGYPADHHQDTNYYCPEERSKLFANMYEPIWDNGENGTPVNDSNHLALYLYKTIQNYGDQVRIWEIWNEPDFDTGGHAWLPDNIDGNWWVNPPDPCDYALKAPAYHYIRMLRVCYEVIKHFDPQDFVAVGGLGYPSFLDVILRYTDNTDGGQVSSQFPLTGGAYFDMLSFHSYPHIDGSLRGWSNEINNFVYFRNSDRAAQGVIENKERFEAVLATYGYGSTYPYKPWIITECNIPRRAFGEYIGSDEAQRNFIIKALIKVQKAKILQLHIYQLAESQTVENAENEFALMGLYEKMDSTDLKKQRLTQEGVAFKTTSSILQGYNYNKERTLELALPAGIDGAAFKKNQDYIYVLWAITVNDKTEAANGHYSFPDNLNIDYVRIKRWDWSETGLSSILTSKDLVLHGDPLFITTIEPDDPDFTVPEPGEILVFPNPASESVKLQFNLDEVTDIEINLLDVKGRLIRVLQSNSDYDSGFYQQYFDISDLTNGIYFLKIKLNKIYIYRKLLYIKV